MPFESATTCRAVRMYTNGPFLPRMIPLPSTFFAPFVIRTVEATADCWRAFEKSVDGTEPISPQTNSIHTRVCPLSINLKQSFRIVLEIRTRVKVSKTSMIPKENLPLYTDFFGTTGKFVNSSHLRDRS